MADAIMGKVPIIACVRSGWTFLAQNWRQLLLAAAICAAISQVGIAAAIVFAQGQGAQPGPLSLIPTILAGLMFTAAVMRKAVRDEFVVPTGLSLGADEGRLLGVGACVALLAIPLVFVFSIIAMATIFSRVAATPEAMEALAENPEAMMQAIEEALGPTGLAILEGALVLLYSIVLGLVAFIQAATIGEKRIVLFQALRWTSGNFFRVLAAMVLTIAPAILVTLLISMIAAPAVADAVTFLIFSVVLAFVGNILAIPIAALGAVLYKGLRPPDFVAK